MEDCIICKILKGEMPSHAVYEDEHILAFLDIFPHTKGHTLVVPKKHGETVFDLDPHMREVLMSGVQKTMERIDSVLHPDGYNVGWNHGKDAGQVVPHLHVHIMPRWKGDGGGSMHSIIKNPGDEKPEEVAKLFM